MVDISMLNDRQRRFITEYVIDLNGSAAAIRSGYTEKTARITASKLLTNPNIRSSIDEQMSEINERNIMKADEVMEILSMLARGDDTEEQIVVEATGDGKTKARNVNRRMSKSDQLKALNMLAKRFGLDSAVNEKTRTVQIVDDIEEDEDGED